MKSLFDDPDFARKFDALASRKKKVAARKLIDADALFESVRKQVIGQDRLARRIADIMADRSARVVPGRPQGVYLISGAPGTGKTEIVHAIARTLYGSADAMFTVHCGSLGTNDDGLQTLTGLGKGFHNSHRGSLFDYIERRKSVGGILFFDEVDKAIINKDSPLQKLQLSIMEKAIVQTRYDGSVCDCSNFPLFMTANTKEKELTKLAATVANEEDLDRQVKETIESADIFRPEFIDRIDLIATVDPLDMQSKAKIVELKLHALAKAYDAEFVRADEGVPELLWEGAERIGATSVRQVINWLEKIGARPIIKATQSGTYRLSVGYDGGASLIVRDADLPVAADLLGLPPAHIAVPTRSTTSDPVASSGPPTLVDLDDPSL